MGVDRREIHRRLLGMNTILHGTGLFTGVIANHNPTDRWRSIQSTFDLLDDGDDDVASQLTTTRTAVRAWKTILLTTVYITPAIAHTSKE